MQLTGETHQTVKLWAKLIDYTASETGQWDIYRMLYGPRRIQAVKLGATPPAYTLS